MAPVDVEIIDNVMVLCALIFNLCIIIVFIARAHQRDHLESALGYVVNLLLAPFVILWVLNLVSGHNEGRLITGMPIILFLVDDFWYRTLGRKKPRHHPDRWPYHLYLYLFLYLVGGMLLVGYVFLVSLFYGFIVLAFFYCSLGAYGYYRYRREKYGGMGS